MNFKYTPLFTDEIKELSRKYPSLRKDFEKLLESLEDNPKMGSSIGNNCYKIRMAIKSKGRGKSGGARVITCVKIQNDSIYFLSIYYKSEQSTITDKEIMEYLKKLDM